MLDTLCVGTLDVLVDTGDHDEALEIAAEMIPRLEANSDVWDLVVIRCVQARIHVLRGQANQGAEMVAWLESSARGSEDPPLIVWGLGSALVRAGVGQDEAATALLTEMDSSPGVRFSGYPALFPEMVRTALGIGARALAEHLVSRLEPRSPYAENALVTSNAALTEARGELRSAADAYADEADRWERIGVVPEQAFALLGQGRCLVGSSCPTEAAPVLREAREIFERLQAAPALAETDALLQQATTLSSSSDPGQHSVKEPTVPNGTQRHSPVLL